MHLLFAIATQHWDRPDVLALPACFVGIALIVLSSHGNLFKLRWRMQAMLAASQAKSCQSHRVLLLQPPTLALPPAFDTQFKLQDGKAVTRELYDTLTAMIKQMNQAIANLSPLKDTITATAAWTRVEILITYLLYSLAAALSLTYLPVFNWLSWGSTADAVSA